MNFDLSPVSDEGMQIDRLGPQMSVLETNLIPFPHNGFGDTCYSCLDWFKTVVI